MVLRQRARAQCSVNGRYVKRAAENAAPRVSASIPNNEMRSDAVVVRSPLPHRRCPPKRGNHPGGVGKFGRAAVCRRGQGVRGNVVCSVYA